MLYRPIVVMGTEWSDRLRKYGCLFVLAVASCAQPPKDLPEPPPGTLRGVYDSNDDFGVLVFRSDGAFGYKFAAHLAFAYTEDNLPPHRGQYFVEPGGEIRMGGVLGEEAPFTMKLSEDKKTILLTRAPDGTLPLKATYRRRVAGGRE